MKVNLKSLALAAGLVFAPTLSFAQQAEEQPNQELKEQLLKLGRQKLKEQPALKQQTEEQETQEVEEIFRSAPASIQHISIPEQIKALSYLQRLEIGVRAYVYIVKCDNKEEFPLQYHLRLGFRNAFASAISNSSNQDTFDARILAMENAEFVDDRNQVAIKLWCANNEQFVRKLDKQLLDMWISWQPEEQQWKEKYQEWQAQLPEKYKEVNVQIQERIDASQKEGEIKSLVKLMQEKKPGPERDDELTRERLFYASVVSLKANEKWEQEIWSEVMRQTGCDDWNTTTNKGKH